MRKQVLVIGESWFSASRHYKGFDQFESMTLHNGVLPLIEAMKESDFELVHMPSHDAVTQLPFEAEALERWDVIVLSDIGSNSLLLHPDVWLHGKPVPNRLKLLGNWAAGGGGLVMVGGYLSFQGIDGKARWRGTAVERALPVSCLAYDDRIEVPDGFRPEIVGPADHPILTGLEGEWPMLLGANEVVLKDGDSVQLLARLPDTEGGHPLLVTGTWGRGRTVAWTSDIGPHWLPDSFVSWNGYRTLWTNIFEWASRPG